MNFHLHQAAQYLTWAIGSTLDAEFYATHAMDSPPPIQTTRERIAGALKELDAYEKALTVPAKIPEPVI